MSLSAWLRARTAEWEALAAALERAGTAPTLAIVIQADDKAEADAIKRGQRPQQVDAIKQALGR